MAEKVEGLSML